eukprot:TRINITY_DN59213_c0_g1_i4.p1 TRINITY_DN59213_c0_g1~~TRINITY_DN59213_c0_g1_i4.p1  ORF type:complete len:767 (-),score=218.33 TRINITY_DN59213_c0_g1_i4:3-2009(-)
MADALQQLTDVRRSLAETDADVGCEEGLRQDMLQTEASIANHRQQVSVLRQAVSQQRDACQATAADTAEMRAKAAGCNTLLSEVKRRTLDLDRVKLDNARAIRKRLEALGRMRHLLRGHSDAMKRSMADVQSKLKAEKQLLDGEIQLWTQQWDVTSSRSLEKKGRTLHIEEDLASQSRQCEALEARIATIAASASKTQADCEQSVAAVAAMTTEQEQINSAMQRAAVNGDRIVRTVGASLPQGLPARLLSELLATAATGTTSLESAARTAAMRQDPAAATDAAMADLAAELKRSSEQSGSDAVLEEQRRAAAAAADQVAGIDSEQARKHAALTDQRASVEADVGSLRETLARRATDDAAMASASRADQSSQHCGSRGEAALADAACLKLEEACRRGQARLAEATGRAAEVEAATLAAEAKVAQYTAALEDGEAATVLATQEAERRAQEPLERQTEEVLLEIGNLKKKLKSELRRREAEWLEHSSKLAKQHDTEVHRLTSVLQEECRSLEDERKTASSSRSQALQAVDGVVERGSQELASVVSKLRDVETEQRLLEDKTEKRRRSSKRLHESLQRLEARRADIQEAISRDAREVEEDQSHLIRLHKEAVARLRRQKENEVARLGSAMQLSLSSLSAELSSDSDAALNAFSDLRAKGERLAQRARIHLDM